MKKMLAVLTALAMMALAIPVMAAAPVNNGSIPVNVNVVAFVEIKVIDTAGITWESLGTGDLNNDLAGKTTRARFKVTANSNYKLTVTAGETWLASDLLPSPYDAYQQVKFVRTPVDGSYIGGSMFLDRTPETAGITGENLRWSGANGNIVTPTYPAEVLTWGLGAAFAPHLYNANGDTNGTPDMVAPVGTYSATALITASIQ